VLYDRSVSPERVAWYLDGANILNVTANQMDAATPRTTPYTTASSSS